MIKDRLVLQVFMFGNNLQNLATTHTTLATTATEVAFRTILIAKESYRRGVLFVSQSHFWKSHGAGAGSWLGRLACWSFRIGAEQVQLWCTAAG